MGRVGEGVQIPRHLIAAKGASIEASDKDLSRCLEDGKQGFWLDIEKPNVDDYALLEKTFKFHALTIDDIRHLNQRPKLEEFDGYAFVVLFTAEIRGKRVQVREHHLYLSNQYLISVHLEPSEPLNRLRDRIKANPDLAHRSLAYLFYLVVEELVNALFPILEKLDDLTEKVEEGILTRADSAALNELSNLKRSVIDLRKFLGAQRDVFQRLTTSSLGDTDKKSNLSASFPREMSIYYRDVYDHLVRQYETVDSLRDLLASSMDIYLSTASNRLNLTITRLTVFATLFLPLTFITGFFGQNFGWLVNHIAPAWIFWAAVAVMLATTAGQLIYYHRRGWI